MLTSRLRLAGTTAFATGTLAAGLFVLATPALAQPMQPVAGKPGLDLALSQAPPYGCSVNYYVDIKSGNDSNPGTKSQPWKTIGNADNGYPNTPVAGECVNVAPGDYPITSTLVMSHGGNADSNDGFVTYRSTVPQGAHIIAEPGLKGDLIQLWAPYIIIDGFNIDGNKDLTAGSGVNGCADGGQNALIAHHFIAFNNIIHDMGGSGLSTCTADYIAWQHNVVYNTSGTSGYQVSALNVWQPKALGNGFVPNAWDNAAAFGIVLAYNKAYDNTEGASIPAPHTDGNGIIIDTTLGSNQCPTCGVPYPGKTLVLGNIAYHNGGGGVHVFLSSNVTVSNNTVYQNYQDLLNPGTARGELSNGGSSNVTWVNNIAYAVPGNGVLAYASSCLSFPVNNFGDSGGWTQNDCYGGPVYSDPNSYVNPLTNLVGVDPKLIDPPLHKFRLLPGSPDYQTGEPEPYLPVPKPDIGAH